MTRAQLDTLKEMAAHGGAKRIPGRYTPTDYVWRIGGKLRTSTIHTLLVRGLVCMAGQDAARLTPRGWTVVKEAA